MNLATLPLADAASMSQAFENGAELARRTGRTGLARWYANIAGHLGAETRRRSRIPVVGEPVHLPLTLDPLADDERHELEAAARKSALHARDGGAAEAAAFYAELAMFLAGIIGPGAEAPAVEPEARRPAPAERVAELPASLAAEIPEPEPAHFSPQDATPAPVAPTPHMFDRAALVERDGVEPQRTNKRRPGAAPTPPEAGAEAAV